MSPFDITPFALPNTAPGEYRFEEPRDLTQIRIHFHNRAPDEVEVHYLRKTWPRTRLEGNRDMENPCAFGWYDVDDQFNTEWQRAAAVVQREDERTLQVTFAGLTAEFPDATDYDVTFRRTLGIRIETSALEEVADVQIFTASEPARSRLRVELDSGTRTLGDTIRFTTYNARILHVHALNGVRVEGESVALLPEASRLFELEVAHMHPAHRYCGDEGHVTFWLDGDAFTICLQSLREQGPIWYAERGVYITFADDPMRFADYQRRIQGAKTLNQRVREHREQSYAGAFHGQPRPHAVSTNLGCKLHRHRFRLEANGDLVLAKWNVTSIPGRDTERFRCDGDARFFFGLERRYITAREPDTPPVLAYRLRALDGDIAIEQHTFAVPLLRSIEDELLSSDETVVAMVRFRFHNTGNAPAVAELPLSYSHRSARSHNAYASNGAQDDYLLPRGERDELFVEGAHLLSDWHGQKVLRARWEGTLSPDVQGRQVLFRQTLQPGETGELLLKIPYIALDQPEELSALEALQFEPCYCQVAAFWRAQARQGAQLVCPEPHLTALHAAHRNYVLVTDTTMPDGSGLVNTSVGTSSYGNFTNEACMIVHELDQRGLHEEARRRIEVWIRYQGTASQPGNFTDYEGMYYGAGGFERGAYNQHHGWALWCIAMHYFLTGDAEWLHSVAPSLIAGCDWVFRQRRNTMRTLPHSRGWEYGFLPAGSLEDVTDFHYWLSTNALTWRGVDTAAKALRAIAHPEAARIQQEADAYRADLMRGFETMRQHTPLVRLRDGRWVPHYPSRLYQRRRDVGWIREVLEGAVYLLISGLYDVRSPQAEWILDDYQDNLYPQPPYGYLIPDFEANWYDHTGFSIQPNLLAGLMPHLQRDEPEIFLWMFFNAWCACYREEVNAMVEHPSPVLGYSNAAHFKTSDEANAVSWLRAMFVYADEQVLHFGRALPREWFRTGKPIATTGVCTRYGKVSVSYHSGGYPRWLSAEVDLSLRASPPKTLVRFRHPDGLPIRSVRVNGVVHERFDPQRGDVDITGNTGRLVVEAEF
ncbi:MAG: hypothetical protein NZ741_08015 [Armatimonadetes bacterium]|nr:hypothetical protein [Armatimonadota bacterium]